MPRLAPSVAAAGCGCRRCAAVSPRGTAASGCCRRWRLAHVLPLPSAAATLSPPPVLASSSGRRSHSMPGPLPRPHWAEVATVVAVAAAAASIAIAARGGRSICAALPPPLTVLVAAAVAAFLHLLCIAVAAADTVAVVRYPLDPLRPQSAALMAVFFRGLRCRGSAGVRRWLRWWTAGREWGLGCLVDYHGRLPCGRCALPVPVGCRAAGLGPWAAAGMGWCFGQRLKVTRFISGRNCLIHDNNSVYFRTSFVR